MIGTESLMLSVYLVCRVERSKFRPLTSFDFSESVIVKVLCVRCSSSCS